MQITTKHQLVVIAQATATHSARGMIEKLVFRLLPYSCVSRQYIYLILDLSKPVYFTKYLTGNVVHLNLQILPKMLVIRNPRFY